MNEIVLFGRMEWKAWSVMSTLWPANETLIMNPLTQNIRTSLKGWPNLASLITELQSITSECCASTLFGCIWGSICLVPESYLILPPKSDRCASRFNTVAKIQRQRVSIGCKTKGRTLQDRSNHAPKDPNLNELEVKMKRIQELQLHPKSEYRSSLHLIDLLNEEGRGIETNEKDCIQNVCEVAPVGSHMVPKLLQWIPARWERKAREKQERNPEGVVKNLRSTGGWQVMLGCEHEIATSWKRKWDQNGSDKN
ncbi:hypothetical protein B0H14DRAFT_2609083 [Mycena olivaceomarginata]|nr:hypothetical protein B0H14DRAFT_2609083 [Mycena olivaceomarginata]